ncbi:MAG: hypothetical protein HC830_00405 [Bacteroidetes bacterium]|nr:hypothetical protein [Bacteroidota bacterium]
MEIKGRDFIQRLKSDDREAYNYLFLKYYMQLFYIALKYLEETEDAKDMVQSTFIKLWESKADLMPDQDIKPYLFIHS